MSQKVVIEENKRRLPIIYKAFLLAFLAFIGIAYIGHLLLTALGVEEKLACTYFLPPWESLIIQSKTFYDADPVYKDEKLYLSVGVGILSVKHRISGPESLIGRVHISSSKDALQYVRLFSSPGTAYMMKNDTWREVIAISAVRADKKPFFFGRDVKPDMTQVGAIEKLDKLWEKDRNSPKESRLRLDGILTDEEWKSNLLPSPEIVQNKDGYIVRRALFRTIVQNDCRVAENIVYWVEEKVTKDGKINRKILRKISLEEEIRLFLNDPTLRM